MGIRQNRKKGRNNADKKGIETVGSVLSVVVEVDRIPWPVGGVSSKITDLGIIWGNTQGLGMG